MALFTAVENPHPPTPRPCGLVPGCEGAHSWQDPRCPGPGTVPSGPGLCLVTSPRVDFARLPFTFECWLAWPAGVAPFSGAKVVAECAGPGWGWTLGFDHSGSLVLTWRSGGEEQLSSSEILADSLLSGVWYHIALLLSAGRCGLLVTEAGQSVARWSAGHRYFTPRRAPAPSEQAVLAIGRTVGDPVPPAPQGLLIGSAAWHARTLEVAAFEALGDPGLPPGIQVDQDLEYGSLGRAFALGAETLCFTAGSGNDSWFAFRVRSAPGRKLGFRHFPHDPMGICVVCSEDGGRSWGRPNGGVWRDSGRMPELAFTHTLATGEALFATSVPVTAGMAAAWLDRTAGHLGGACLEEVGHSRLGAPLRVLAIGNPEAPWVYLQAGQHNMMERLGFFLITALFEAVAADRELLARTRWIIMPLVNLDSYTVPAVDGNMNRFWGKPGGAPTVRALEAFLRAQAARAPGQVLLDLHAGTIWRGHTLLCDDPAGRSLPEPVSERFSRRGVESAAPELEQALRAEGLDYAVFNEFARIGESTRKAGRGMLDSFARSVLGVPIALTVELSAIAADSPEGVKTVTPGTLRAEGQRWYRALRRYLLGSGSGS